MRRLLLFISVLFSAVAFAQPSNPVINASQIFADSATISWTKPATADSFVLQRSLDSSTWSQVYAGKQQVYYDTSVDGNTNYYYRVKAINSSTTGESGFVGKHIKTFWSPDATSQGGNRIATAADVANATLNPDGFINEGDYLYVGYRGATGYTLVGVPYQWGKTIYLTTPPALAAGKKICIIGNTGYDYIEIDMSNNPGTVDNPVIITNLNGQVRCGQLRLTNCKHVLVTGKYDPTAKTGNANYLGFNATDWTNLYGSFGFYIQSTWGQRAGGQIIISGDCEDVRFEGIQAGEGGFASIIAKNDSYYAADKTGITSTGSLSTYADVSQTSFNLPTNPKWTPERIRLTLNTLTTVNIDSIYFVGTGTTTGTYSYQAESFDGSNHATNNGSTVTLTSSSSSDLAYLDIPTPGLPKGGTFTYHVVMSNTTAVSLTDHVASTPFDGITIRYCYFADGGSEGIYWMSTQPFPTQLGKNVDIQYNVYARNGGNSLQLGNLGGTNTIAHNVLIGGGYEWSNAFQKFQGFGVQFSTRQAKVNFRDNLFLGSNEQFFNWYIGPTAYDTSQFTDTAKIVNNAFLNSRPHGAADMGPKIFGKVTFVIDSNHIGRMGNGTYNKLFSDSAVNRVFKVTGYGGQGVVNAHGNVYDSTTLASGTFINTGDANVTVTQANNTRQNTVPYPMFKNYNDKDSTYDYANEETWTDVWEPQWNATNRTGTKFDSVAAAQGVAIGSVVYPRVYDLGNIVRHNGKFYKSLIANNSGHMPTGYTDPYWELQVFSNGSVMPIDDVRQVEGSFYAEKGIGLNYVVPNTPAVDHNPHFKYKKGSRIIVKQAY